MKTKRIIAIMMSAMLCAAVSPLPSAMTGFAENSEPEDHIHAAECSNPTVCVECGAEIPYDENTIYHSQYYVQTEEGHQRVCACGEMNEEPEGHYVTCDHPGVCRLCHAESDLEPEHEDELVSSDEEYDYFSCACGEYQLQELHEDDCDNPGICCYCGQSEEDGIVIGTHSHVYGEDCIKYKDDEYHTLRCVCGEEALDFPHVISCLNKEHICAECGAYTPNASIVHNETVGADADSCYIYCRDCGIEIARLHHYTNCLDPDAEYCSFCGFPLSEATHYEKGLHGGAYDDVYEKKGVTYHECICYDCGETLLEKHEVTLVARDNGDPTAHDIVCADDGYVIEIEEHTWVMDEEKGVYVCSVCGAVGDEKAETTVTTAATTTAATETTTTGSSGRFASDEELCTMSIEDYRQKTGVTAAKAESSADADGMLSIVLSDDAGNVLDTYTIDPATGKGQDSSGSEVDLPQTGNNSVTNLLLGFGALLMTGCGLYAVRASGIMRRKEDVS